MILSAKYLYLFIILLAGFYIIQKFRRGERDIIWFAIFSLPLTLITAKIAGFLFYDPRPFVSGHFIPLIKHAADNGFPSDHALLSFALASLIFVFDRKLGTLAFLIGILVGYSRVYVGVHSPLDIIGSFVISVIVAALVKYFLKFIKPPKILDLHKNS